MSYATGFVLNNMNVGTFNTWGWEGHVDVDVLKGQDFRWNVGLNVSHTGSEVVQRFPSAKTPCNVNGLCADCKSPDSCCCHFVHTRLCRPAGRIKVVLVGEDLGL